MPCVPRLQHHAIREIPADSSRTWIFTRCSSWLRASARSRSAIDGWSALYDASSPYTLSFPGRVSETVLQVPRRMITKEGHAFTDLTATPLPDSASMHALQNLLWSVDPRTTRDFTQAESDMLTDATTTLLQAALLPANRKTTPATDNHTLARSLRSYIDEHLTDPSLTVEHLAHANHVSVRLVYKVFAEHLDDSPSDYLRRRRLSVAHRQLSLGHTVLEAAFSSGFTNPDTFTRAFKRRYGYPPSTLKAGTSQDHER